jgi:hypothetical protein
VARLILNAIDNPVLEHRKTKQKIHLSFDKCQFVQLLRPEIEALAKRDLGDIEKPDMTDSLYQARKRWLLSLR